MVWKENVEKIKQVESIEVRARNGMKNLNIAADETSNKNKTRAESHEKWLKKKNRNRGTDKEMKAKQEAKSHKRMKSRKGERQ